MADSSYTRVLFEPWGLGDALIAAATLREAPTDIALACHSRWHSLLRAALDDVRPLRLLAVDLPYTSRSGQGGEVQSWPRQVQSVLSIRGDLRDRRAARHRFPHARILMTGWLEFLARRSALVDTLFTTGALAQTNHYRAWARLAGVPFERIESRYASQASAGGLQVVMHLGAQWGAKQYPHAAELADCLEDHGHRVTLLAGPGDRLPPGVPEDRVQRRDNGGLVDTLRAADLVIANDSGPMHLAALLGCRTWVIARAASITAWLPPGVQAIVARSTPRGHRPDRRYTSDQILPGWPSAADAAQRVREGSLEQIDQILSSRKEIADQAALLLGGNVEHEILRRAGAHNALR